jgi:hypothetical protein
MDLRDKPLSTLYELAVIAAQSRARCSWGTVEFANGEWNIPDDNAVDRITAWAIRLLPDHFWSPWSFGGQYHIDIDRQTDDDPHTVVSLKAPSKNDDETICRGLVIAVIVKHEQDKA